MFMEHSNGPVASTNPCRLCAPLGASIAFKGIEGCLPLLHGAQGCATYIRRYLISHFREPVDIASSSFDEKTVVFGGKENLLRAIKNIEQKYHPALIGIATSCLSETIGDDVPRYLDQIKKESPDSPLCVYVSTPSYRGSHSDGFRETVMALTANLAQDSKTGIRVGMERRVNIFAPMVSPAELRWFKQIISHFDLEPVLVPDYSETLDGATWPEYQALSPGGTTLEELKNLPAASMSLDFLSAPGERGPSEILSEGFGTPSTVMPLPIGLEASDLFYSVLENLSGGTIPSEELAARGRLVDSYADGHKYLFGKRVAILAPEELCSALTKFCNELGMIVVFAGTGGRGGRLSKFLEKEIAAEAPPEGEAFIAREDVDYGDLDEFLESSGADLIISGSKGYKSARQFNVPLLRVGFPIHDRFSGPRMNSLGYLGTHSLLDRIIDTLLEHKQRTSKAGYTYI